MGEAKRRKQTEPDFGRLPKETYRGLVVSSPLEVEGTRLTIKSSSLHPQELRFALLFWDRLVWPTSRAVHFASNGDEKYLEAAGVLTRPDYTLDGDVAQAIAKGQVKAYEDLAATEPGVWALAEGENSFIWRDGLLLPDTGALIELHRSIPIPRSDVPLDEILEFKERRKDELIHLRRHLELLVADVKESEDPEATLQTRINELDEACANLLSVSREWQCPVYLANLKASFSLSPSKLIPAIGTGWLAGNLHGLVAATAAAAIAGAASTIELKGDYGLRSTRRPKSPYRYAYHIQSEL